MKNKIIFSITVIAGLIAFVVGPLIVQYSHWPHGSNGNGDWLSFWGSYLGIIPSGLIAALVAGYQIKEANKQSDKTRKQELSIMKNTKIVDYLYEIKSVLSKSKVIINTDKRFLTNEAIYNYLQKEEHVIFEEVNWKTLKNQNNYLYFLSEIVFNKSRDKEIFRGIIEYTNNIKLLDKFIVECEHHIYDKEDTKGGRNSEHPNRIESTLGEMINQLDGITALVEKKISDLSA